MKKNLFIEISLCILALLTVYSPYAWSQAEVKRPNIVIILADDMGYSVTNFITI